MGSPVVDIDVNNQRQRYMTVLLSYKVVCSYFVWRQFSDVYTKDIRFFSGALFIYAFEYSLWNTYSLKQKWLNFKAKSSFKSGSTEKN